MDNFMTLDDFIRIKEVMKRSKAQKKSPGENYDQYSKSQKYSE